MPILADAVVQKRCFAGLCELNLCANTGILDPPPLYSDIAAAHKCPLLQTLLLWTAGQSIVALQEAFAAGAFPAVINLDAHILAPPVFLWVGGAGELAGELVIVVPR